jgi:Zn-finger nucleic acid-binding protein
MSLNCPRCKHAFLEEIELREIPLDRCPCCAGIWFDNAEVSELTRLKNQLSGFESIVPSSSFHAENMPCPKCDGVTLRRLVMQSGGRDKILYRCASCLGTWIDRGELRESEDPNLAESLTAFFSDIKIVRR